MPGEFTRFQLVYLLDHLLRQKPFGDKRSAAGCSCKRQHATAGSDIGFAVLWHIGFLIFEERKGVPYRSGNRNQKLAIQCAKFIPDRATDNRVAYIGC